jgi:hypothetical protein
MDALLLTLVWICLIVAACWLVIWVLGQLGVPLPQRVIQIAWVIVVLLILLLLWRSFGSMISLPHAR